MEATLSYKIISSQVSDPMRHQSQMETESSIILLVHVIQRIRKVPSTISCKADHVARSHKITQHDTTQRDTAHETRHLLIPGYQILHPSLSFLCTSGVGVLLLEHLVAEFQFNEGIVTAMHADIPNHFSLLYKN